jgi:uncharacterized protein (DUF58 family)
MELTAPLFRRLTEKFQSLAFFRAGPRDAMPLQIGNRRIYVLPNRFGLFVGLALLAMTVGGLNFNNNAALLMVFLLISLCNNALIAGHLSLLGLQIRIQGPMPVFAGQRLQLGVSLQQLRNPEAKPYIIRFKENTVDAMVGADSSQFMLEIETQRRGRFAIERLSITSMQPMGIAKAWSYVNTQDWVWVYPAPQGRPLQPQYHAADGSGSRHSRQLSDQPHHLRDYVSGDSRKQIAWKASARTGILQVREYEQAQAGDLLLDWYTLQALDTEARLSQLCLWLVQAEQKHLRYALKLPGLLIQAGHGSDHHRKCLEALAGMPDG